MLHEKKEREKRMCNCKRKREKIVDGRREVGEKMGGGGEGEERKRNRGNRNRMRGGKGGKGRDRRKIEGWRGRREREEN